MVSFRSLDALSLAIGAAVCAGLMLLMAQGTPTISPLFRVQYMPHPRDMVQVHEGTPYFVPAGRVFVVTAVGCAGGGANDVALHLDGIRAFVAKTWGPTSDICVREVPHGLSVSAGKRIDAVTIAGLPAADAVVWGYLADA